MSENMGPDHYFTVARRAMALMPSPTNMDRVNRGLRGKFGVVYPFALHALEQARAALLLCEQGHAYAAEANVRAAFEHALTCQWIVYTHGGEHEFAKRLDNSQRLILENWNPSIPLDAEIYDRFKDSRDSEHGQVKSFEQRLNRFAGSETSWYVYLYRWPSDSVHPGMRTVNYHAEFNSAGNFVRFRFDAPTFDATSVGYGVALSVMLAVGAVAALFSDEDLKFKVGAMSDEVGLPCYLDVDDKQPDLQRPPAGDI